METKTYATIKLEHEGAISAILERNQVFFAFSNEQLEKGKAEIGVKEDKELTGIGAGGFIKRANIKAFADDMDKEAKHYREELKQAKLAKNEAILYELRNHECFYTGDIEPVVDKFKGIYTIKDIQAVYKRNIENE